MSPLTPYGGEGSLPKSRRRFFRDVDSVIFFEVLTPLLKKLMSRKRHAHDADISTAFLNKDMNGNLYVNWGEVD